MNTTSTTNTNTTTSTFEIDQDVIDWLLDGDVSIQYQVNRDLLLGDQNKQDLLRQRIALEGWGKQYLDAYNPSMGHWGNGFYQPKWISSHYTLLDLRHLCIMPTITIQNTITKILIEEKSNIDGGIDCHNHNKGKGKGNSKYNSDICVNGMFLFYACYFGVQNDSEDQLHSIIDFILSEQMNDGGFNCRSNHRGSNPKCSSVHTTISILEGFVEYIKQHHTYRIADVQKASKDGWEFLLKHQLYLSIKKNPNQIINERFLKFPYPTRWYYDILRALDYWQYTKLPWDDRLQSSIDILLSKQKKDGKWNLNSKYNGLTHFEMEKAGKPSRWNTLRALRVLKHYHNTTKQQQQKNILATATTTTTKTKRRKDSNDDARSTSKRVNKRRRKTA